MPNSIDSAADSRTNCRLRCDDTAHSIRGSQQHKENDASSFPLLWQQPVLAYPRQMGEVLRITMTGECHDASIAR
jgi:hypothetical protein